ncbi:hypothetical protein [Dyadobacter luticola]|uniref:Uncharacterized protein n=1 Tax=Dyadobacter luticola TaxID=1979387 RepID=A0A5R9KZC0_9BACT|nr:hypothetical protein [Dyadobacter luticola]TLV01440.1 hypothetical protein FEN17_18600 [Dyadobacter luticola]
MNILNSTILFLILFFCLVQKTSAQLTVFNVSSSDITDGRKISAQQQFEITDVVESSTTFTYGLGRNWEIGANVINVDYDYKTRHFETNDTTTSSPFAPLLLINTQKVFELSDLLSVGIGAVAGANVASKHASRLVYYGYANLAASFGDQERYQLAAGPYVGNHRYLSDGTIYGFQTGMDLGIWYKKLHLMADWISGYHSKGRLTAGIEIFLTERLPLSLGWQRSNSDGSQGAVVQLTFLPK